MFARMNVYKNQCLLLAMLLVLAACSNTPPAAQTPSQMVTGTPTLEVPDTATPLIVPTRTNTQMVEKIEHTATATNTSTATPQPQVCSPLPEIPLADIVDHISNPFHPPVLGSDDPHQGIDLAVLSDPDRIALSGAPVGAILSGQAAAVIQNMFPYGNAILIETPLERLPEDFVHKGHIPNIAPTLSPHRSLTCPQTGEYPNWDAEKRSIYVLYAHMQQPPQFQVGDRISCGELLGTIGDSGNALHPHLHIEVRTGPAGARFAGLSHYDTRATPLEMEAYCIWRVSNIFQLLDPLTLISPNTAIENAP